MLRIAWPRSESRFGVRRLQVQFVARTEAKAPVDEQINGSQTGKLEF
jgi:hypothetical protein